VLEDALRGPPYPRGNEMNGARFGDAMGNDSIVGVMFVLAALLKGKL
jgi:hypothetical protein